MINNILDRKKTFFGDKHFKSPKITFFAKGLTHGFPQNSIFFSLLLLVKITQETMLNIVLDRKETLTKTMD